MLQRLSILLAIAILVVVQTPTTMAADAGNKKQVSESRADDSVDRHGLDVRILDRSYHEALTALNKSYLADREAMRRSITKKLKKHQQSLTEQGRLDDAVEVRDQIERFRLKKIAPPEFDGKSSTRPGKIVGTWRWNNGVDITNHSDGTTNGSGTWRKVDDAENVFVFDWKKIPSDRVKLSPNGRILEGTKSHDLKFRVWAVRID